MTSVGIGELRRSHRAVLFGPVEGTRQAELARPVSALERARATVSVNVVLAEAGAFGGAVTVKAGLLSVRGWKRVLAGLVLGEGRSRDGWREVAEGVDRGRGSDRLDPAVSADLLKLRRSTGEGELSREGRAGLRGEHELPLLALQILNLLLKGDLKEGNKEFIRNVSLRKLMRKRHTCCAS